MSTQEVGLHANQCFSDTTPEERTAHLDSLKCCDATAEAETKLLSKTSSLNTAAEAMPSMKVTIIRTYCWAVKPERTRPEESIWLDMTNSQEYRNKGTISCRLLFATYSIFNHSQGNHCEIVPPIPNLQDIHFTIFYFFNQYFSLFFVKKRYFRNRKIIV